MCKDSDFFEIFYYLCTIYVLWRTIFFFMKQKRFFFYIFLFVILSTLGSCNKVKYVPEEKYLKKKVKIKAKKMKNKKADGIYAEVRASRIHRMMQKNRGIA